MKTFNPHFRRFLFMVDALFVLGCLLPAMLAGPGNKSATFSGYLAGSLFVIGMICALPLVLTLAFGGFGNAALKRLAKREDASWGWVLLGAIFFFNSMFMSLLLMHKFFVFGICIDVIHLHFLGCVTCFVAMYHKVVFRRPAVACCADVRHWLTA